MIQNNLNPTKTAIITGGAKRLGRDMALCLAKMGYDLLIHYHNSELDALELKNKISQEFSVKCTIFCCDLSDISGAEKLSDEISTNHTNSSLLINNASIFYQSNFLEETKEDFAKNFNLHFMAPMLLSKAFAKIAIKNKIPNAQIINLLDKNIARFDTAYFHYLLTKKFLAELTKMLALQLAPHIRVNGIAPSGGFNDTINSKNPAAELEIFAKINPLKRALLVKNILQTLEFVVSNDFLNGQIISIDGGSSLNHAG